jgi:hypothetical protein
MIPIAWEAWKFGWKESLAVVGIPLGYLAWSLYRLAINDLRPDFGSPQRFIYSMLVSPSAYQILTEQQFTPLAPFKAIAVIMKSPHWSVYGDLVIASLFVTLFVLSIAKLRTSYALYCLAIVLVSLSLHTGSAVPYMSLPRHLVLAFPVFIGWCLRYEFRRPYLVMTYLCIAQMMFLCGFVWESWVL